MRIETTTLNGQSFFVRHWGDESLPKMLMLHGFPEYGGSWSDLAERLSHRFHIIAPDQRGYGQSWAPADVSAYTTSELVKDMAALIGDDPLIVLGHDWGAAVAYGLAMFRPELVQKLIIMNGVHPAPFQRAMAAGGPQTEASQYIHYLRKDGSEDHLAADNFAKLRALFSAKMDMSWLTGATLETYLAEWSRPGRLRGMVNWYRASPLQVPLSGQSLPDLPAFDPARLKVRCPHLLIWGSDDTALLPAATEGLEEFARDLTRVEIAGADHWLHHQKPDEVAQAILSWLD
ncbi:alpha/beta hydrolase [Sulfitobacter mediterraneus]|uniref:alpha/beta fold hydrolase n=1 Tax=Sulfitobacter mediterraneus TaxID=83219 RepID=UPI001931DF57|nr:alpha/beta hydrolase [Sulfitobacter mediterraneus]MBM1634100.1 alpha/beta hydrolase [Sulfitobacter mediterraneus]MBM1641385.1 alpha/beta hydrolase [Sulfitobacter mediterraneus]MBM1645965.1 alpha/beta hydrolase [Sulfitobacter mediterraneus]MBM1649504.1 alpha/beta hydrolase [Sulfitobacter mediterraneus]MBM1654033.1 alpha/beta hydrolase [Sulfitobacter mediterraneus]